MGRTIKGIGPMTPELVKKIKKAKKANPEMTYRELGLRFSCSGVTIGKAIRSPDKTVEIPAPDRRRWLR
jgi:hypothetical protein